MTDEKEQDNAHEDDCKIILITPPVGIELPPLVGVLPVSPAPPAGGGDGGLGAQGVVLVLWVVVVGIVAGVVAWRRSGAAAFSSNLEEKRE